MALHSLYCADVPLRNGSLTFVTQQQLSIWLYSAYLFTVETLFEFFQPSFEIHSNT